VLGLASREIIYTIRGIGGEKKLIFKWGDLTTHMGGKEIRESNRPVG